MSIRYTVGYQVSNVHVTRSLGTYIVLGVLGIDREVTGIKLITEDGNHVLIPNHLLQNGETLRGMFITFAEQPQLYKDGNFAVQDHRAKS